MRNGKRFLDDWEKAREADLAKSADEQEPITGHPLVDQTLKQMHAEKAFANNRQVSYGEVSEAPKPRLSRSQLAAAGLAALGTVGAFVAISQLT